MQNQLLDSVGMTSLLSHYTNNYSLDSNPSKMTLEYTSYLIRVSLNGGLHEIVSAMAPCPWSYFEIAKKLSKRKQYIKTEVFRKWIDFYSSYESVRQVEDVKDILNELSRNADETDKKLMKDHFNTSTVIPWLIRICLSPSAMSNSLIVLLLLSSVVELEG